MSEAISDFFRHMSQWDHASKADMMNVVQYSLMAVVPVMLLNKLIYWYMPVVDESKDSWMLVLEIVMQVALMFVGLFMVHRFVIYFPTYSGESYGEFVLMPTILASLMIVLSLNTKIGEKAAILTERLQVYWETGQVPDASMGAGREGMRNEYPAHGGAGGHGGGAGAYDAQTGGMSSAQAHRPPEPMNTTSYASSGGGSSGAGMGGAGSMNPMIAPGGMPVGGGGLVSLAGNH